jgi:hypothetical protein
LNVTQEADREGLTGVFMLHGETVRDPDNELNVKPSLTGWEFHSVDTL